MENILRQLPDFNEWTSYKFIDLGWSSDKKFKVQQDKQKFLIRLFKLDELPYNLQVFSFIKSVYEQGITCSKPIECGPVPTTNYGFMKLSYLEGESLENAHKNLPIKQQYQLGISAGRILKKIHAIPLKKSVNQQEILAQLTEKKLKQVQRYADSSYQLFGQEEIIQFIKENISEISKRGVCWIHGDFHPGNLILKSDKTLGVIDFNRFEISDPFEEFLKIGFFTVESSTAFSLGQIDGYFENDIPTDFWKALKIYSYQTALASIIWAEQFNQSTVDQMIERYNRVQADYANSSNNQPVWVEETRNIF